MRLVLIIASVLVLAVLAWLAVMPSFTAAMMKNPAIDLRVQNTEPICTDADVTIVIRAPDQFSVDGKAHDFEGLKQMIQLRIPKADLSVRLVCNQNTGFETISRVSDLLRTSGVGKLLFSVESGAPNPPAETPGMIAPSKAVETPVVPNP